VKQFTVIGIYEDNGQRYATCVEAETPDEAEEIALRAIAEDSGETLLIAGTIEGDHNMAS
jgi:hypothetical protein